MAIAIGKILLSTGVEGGVTHVWDHMSGTMLIGFLAKFSLSLAI